MKKIKILYFSLFLTAFWRNVFNYFPNPKFNQDYKYLYVYTYNCPFNHNLKVYFHVNDANIEVPKYH